MRNDGFQAGYSMIEAVVAIIILGVAILPMASMFDSALNASQKSGDYDKARSLANETLEEIRALDYEVAAGTYAVENPPRCDTGKFSCEVEAKFVDENLQPNTTSPSRMLVSVEVAWDGKTYETAMLMTSGLP